ncbi:hypothetical protein D3C71_1591530 [compost metagenome]
MTALISSAGVRAGKSLLMATIIGPRASMATGARLLTGSKGSRGWMAALVVMLDETATRV